jgi:hypothetical protein
VFRSSPLIVAHLEPSNRSSASERRIGRHVAPSSGIDDAVITTSQGPSRVPAIDDRAAQ